MSELPSPMTPADSRFRNAEFMPFPADPNDFNSDWFMMPPRIKAARITLMQWSWISHPVASLHNSPDRYFNIVRESKANWKKIGPIVMAPWVLCSDGRLYHPWLAEQANRILRVGEVRNRRLSSTSPGKWKALRAEVFLRDDFTCNYCGERGGILECDHVTPVAAGGGDDLSNLVTACQRCNTSKGATVSEAWGNVINV